MAQTHNNITLRSRVSSWLYSTLGCVAVIGPSQDQAGCHAMTWTQLEDSISLAWPIRHPRNGISRIASLMNRSPRPHLDDPPAPHAEKPRRNEALTRYRGATDILAICSSERRLSYCPSRRIPEISGVYGGFSARFVA